MITPFLAVALLTSAYGAVSPNPRVAALRAAGREIVKTVTLSVPGGETIRSVVYGNAQYGYFESETFTRQPGAIRLELVPPGFRYPVEFWLRGKNLHRSRRVTFSSPFPPEETRRAEVKTAFSSPYVLLAGTVGKWSAPEGESRQAQKYFHYYLNRQGERVWAYLAAEDFQTRESDSYAKPAGGGRLQIMSCSEYHDSSFEEIDFRGTRRRRWYFPDETCHHDFFRRGDRLFRLASQFHYYRQPLRFWNRPTAFRGSTLVERGLDGGNSISRWDLVVSENPFRERDWHWNIGYRAEEPRPDGGSGWWDVMHANSVEDVPGVGVLISVRNYNRVLLLDASMTRILWTVGPGRSNTYATGGTPAEFRMQHHAQLLPNGNLLLFDNGLSASRIVELRLDDRTKRAHLVREFVPKDRRWSQFCGSAYFLPNGNLIALFSGLGTATDGGTVVEFDGVTSHERSRTVLAGDWGSGRRAIPVFTIGNEHYLGDRLPAELPHGSRGPFAGEEVNRGQR